MSEEPKHSTVLTRNLWRRMTARGLTPNALSERIGRSRSYIGDLFKGKIRNPGAKKLLLISEVLECTPDDLLREPVPEPEHEPAEAALLEKGRADRRRALAIAERAMGDEDSPERASLVFDLAEQIYWIMVERERAGSATDESEEGFWAGVDGMARRYIASRR